MRTMLDLITTLKSFRHSNIIITSIYPNKESFIASKYAINAFLIVAITAIIGTATISAHVIHYVYDLVHLNVQVRKNHLLKGYHHNLPDSIDQFINHLLVSDFRIVQTSAICTKKELFSRSLEDWQAFSPKVTVMHPFCCPGFENSDSIVNAIKKMFKSLKTSQQQPLITPVSGWISSGFGMRTDPVFEGTAFHKGVDIAAPIGTPVFCAADGFVTFCGWKPFLGNSIFVRLNHTELLTIYGHLHTTTISENDSVFQGQIIGNVGSTGKSTGPHLHFEIRLNEVSINPISFLLPPDTLID